MKKFNLLLLATLLAGSLAAQSVTYSYTVTDTVKKDTSTPTTGGTITFGADKFETQNGVLAYKLDGDIEASSTKYVLVEPTNAFQAGDVIKVGGFCTGSAGSAGIGIFAARANNEQAIAIHTMQTKNTTEYLTYTVQATDAIVGKNQLYIFRNASSSYFLSVEIVSTPKTEPWLTLSATDVELAVTPFAASDEAKVTLKGGNLTAGNYTLTVPNVAGLTVEPASVTVAADGTVNQDIKLTYTSTVDVPEATAKVSVTINELPAELTITYSARTTAYTQTTVSDSTTWDWTKAGIKEILLDSTSTPSLLDTIILANVPGIYNGADFRSDALKVCGQYLVRDSKYFQGGYISFIAEKKGTVQVTFSNTGNRDADKGLGRVLYINDVATNDSTLTTKTLTVSAPVEVPAGQVTITSQMPSQPGISQYLRVYSITFVPQETGTALEQNSLFVPATKVIRNGQLLIIREGKTYTVQGVEVK